MEYCTWLRCHTQAGIWQVLDQPQEAIKQCGHWHLPIQIVQLPTYASWCNPIEKLWGKLKQDQLHLHPWAEDLSTLRKQILSFFQQFEAGSAELLRSVGLQLPY